MARKLTVGKAPQGHPLKGGSPIARGGPGFIGARGATRTSAGGGRRAGKAKPTTAGSGTRMGSSNRRQRSAGAR